jgi:hypothetical protein
MALPVKRRWELCEIIQSGIPIRAAKGVKMCHGELLTAFCFGKH